MRVWKMKIRMKSDWMTILKNENAATHFTASVNTAVNLLFCLRLLCDVIVTIFSLFELVNCLGELSALTVWQVVS